MERFIRLQTQVFQGLLIAISPLAALAATYEWSSGYGQGTTEYHVDDGNGNSLAIWCPHGRAKSASAQMITRGFDYNSPKDSIEIKFVIDGVEFDDPFNTSCRACENNFVQSFWPALLKANNLFVRADGYEVRFPTKGLSEELLPLDHPANPCLTESQAFSLENQTYAPAQEARPTLPAGFTNLAIIDDPDGYTNMRSQKSAKSQNVARVVQGEQFFTYMQDGNWWQVRTAQGKVGYMHISRIRLLD
ncbi:SH3 domain-containing protein [Paenalcaligenes niemegkensis]|uniref:SH3 domain-containing protein n=1 Tax=Paenalcaligenes niemegkensis TaxID=2895469 RepID=UPI001EE7A68D|nr:SH3 domain-containing protein [Paenalcaligenes niemegkensis]MCQ9616353.1 SH3 domain-containing protein [Paenalcaligenes niemegkensis]